MKSKVLVRNLIIAGSVVVVAVIALILVKVITGKGIKKLMIMKKIL